jgi:hypothetical protein
MRPLWLTDGLILDKPGKKESIQTFKIFYPFCGLKTPASSAP